MRVAFRADASKAIGIGHIRRCRALADVLKTQGAELLFVCRDQGLRYEEILSQPPLLLQQPPRTFAPENDSPPHAVWLGVDQRQDAEDTIAKLADWRPDWIVVDHYALDARWHGLVKGALDCSIAVIDDIADRAIEADMLIDHNLEKDHDEKYAPWLTLSTTMLCGPRFALLDSSYAGAPPYQFHDEVRSIGICMGGVDEVNANIIALLAVRDTGFSGPVEIATTSANPNLLELRAIAEEQNSNIFLSVDVPNLAEFFARHDLQIGAGGGSTWERLCIGAPTIAVAIADNQRQVIKELNRQKFEWGLEQLDRRAIKDVIDNALHASDQRREMSKRAKILVDGKGAIRVAKHIVPRRALRLATISDAIIAYEWRNSEMVRRFSHNSDEIAFADHLAWWLSSLDNTNRSLLILELGGEPAGVLRYDYKGSNALVSIYCDPRQLGFGLGPELLRMGEKWLATHHQETKRIAAEIHPDNAPSISAFNKAGFQQITNLRYERTVGAVTETSKRIHLGGTQLP